MNNSGSAICLLPVALAALACLIPTRRALAVEPTVALRSDPARIYTTFRTIFPICRLDSMRWCALATSPSEKA